MSKNFYGYPQMWPNFGMMNNGQMMPCGPTTPIPYYPQMPMNNVKPKDAIKEMEKAIKFMKKYEEGKKKDEEKKKKEKQEHHHEMSPLKVMLVLVTLYPIIGIGMMLGMSYSMSMLAGVFK